MIVKTISYDFTCDICGYRHNESGGDWFNMDKAMEHIQKCGWKIINKHSSGNRKTYCPSCVKNAAKRK